MLIILSPGQSLGDIYVDENNDPFAISIYKGTDSGIIENKDDPLVGVIQNDGTIKIDLWGEGITSGQYKNYVRDVFNTTWTKQ